MSCHNKRLFYNKSNNATQRCKDSNLSISFSPNHLKLKKKNNNYIDQNSSAADGRLCGARWHISR